MRIVSLTCSNTEIVCALGLAESLVGVDAHSDHPFDVVAQLPRVGKDLDIDVEAVMALKPDLVLASLTVPGHEAVVERVDASGLPYLAPAPERLTDVYDDIHTIGEALGVPEAARTLVLRMQHALNEGAPSPDGPRVLVEWWPKPVIVPGKRSWVTDLIELAGGRSAFGQRDVKSTPVTDEEVTANPPDVVVVSWCGVPDSHLRTNVVTRRAAWVDVPAVRNDRVHIIPEAFLGRPGPRLVEGFFRLRDVISGAREHR